MGYLYTGHLLFRIVRQSIIKKLLFLKSLCVFPFSPYENEWIATFCSTIVRLSPAIWLLKAIRIQALPWEKVAFLRENKNTDMVEMILTTSCVLLQNK